MAVLPWSCLLLTLAWSVCRGDPLVPALIIFGDSVADVGNNNRLNTIIKANFLPYGRDFVNHQPTGRFSNGKLATDITAELLGFPGYQPAYLSDEANGTKLLTGVNFASAGSGLYGGTAALYNTISLTQQLNYYKEYQSRVASLVGQKNANSIFSKGIHLLSAGSSDYIQNYYVNPLLYRTYTVDQFSDILVKSFSNFVEDLHGMGVRRIGVTTLPPLGCLPASITVFGQGSNQCVERLNQDAASYNSKLKSTAQGLGKSLPGLKVVVLDIYNPLMNIIRKPGESGFFETRRACCGTGTLETSVLCNERSPGTCTNATEYAFWDGYHPSQAANEALANELIGQGFDLLS